MSVGANLRRTSVGGNFESMLARKNNILEISWNFQRYLSIKSKYVYISEKIQKTPLWVWKSIWNFENLRKFYKNFEVSLDDSVIFYTRVHIFFCIFFKKMLGSSVKNVGRQKSQTDVGRRKSQKDFFEIIQTLTFCTLRWIFFLHFFLNM